jgi:hypothetical protein
LSRRRGTSSSCLRRCVFPPSSFPFPDADFPPRMQEGKMLFEAVFKIVKEEEAVSKKSKKPFPPSGRRSECVLLFSPLSPHTILTLSVQTRTSPPRPRRRIRRSRVRSLDGLLTAEKSADRPCPTSFSSTAWTTSSFVNEGEQEFDDEGASVPSSPFPSSTNLAS